MSFRWAGKNSAGNWRSYSRGRPSPFRQPHPAAACGLRLPRRRDTCGHLLQITDANAETGLRSGTGATQGAPDSTEARGGSVFLVSHAESVVLVSARRSDTEALEACEPPVQTASDGHGCRSSAALSRTGQVVRGRRRIRDVGLASAGYVRQQTAAGVPGGWSGLRSRGDLLRGACRSGLHQAGLRSGQRGTD